MYHREPFLFVESILGGEEENPDIFWNEDNLPEKIFVEREELSVEAFMDEGELLENFPGEENFVNVGSPLEEERPDNPVIVDPITGEILFDDSSESDRLDRFSYVNGTEVVGDTFKLEGEIYVIRRTPIIWKSEDIPSGRIMRSVGEFCYIFIFFSLLSLLLFLFLFFNE